MHLTWTVLGSSACSLLLVACFFFVASQVRFNRKWNGNFHSAFFAHLDRSHLCIIQQLSDLDDKNVKSI